MNPGIAKAVVLVASAVMVAIRAPHGKRSRALKTVRSGKGTLEVGLLALAWIGFLIPIIWALSPAFASADYPLHVTPFAAGVAFLAAGLLVFHRAHAALGSFWSVTLEVRENHRLISQGIYRRVRHPMYSALFLYAIGQTLVVPNWIAGPSYLVAFVIVFAFRIRAEEQMMVDAFGDEYVAYMANTKRLVPGIW